MAERVAADPADETSLAKAHTSGIRRMEPGALQSTITKRWRRVWRGREAWLPFASAVPRAGRLPIELSIPKERYHGAS